MDTEKNGNAIDVWNRLQRVHQVISREVQKNFYDKGITAAQFEVLMELKKFKRLPMWKISELLSVTGGNVTGLVDRLEKKGLVARERSEKDRRIILAKITKRGEIIYQNAIGNFEKNLLSILSSLHDGELQEFNILLEKLHSCFNDEDEFSEDEEISIANV